MMNKNFLINKRGFSLLELLLVLAIIAALVVAAFIVYPKVQASQRAEAESKNIATIQAGVKSLFSSSSSYAGLSNGGILNALSYLGACIRWQAYLLIMLMFGKVILV